RLRPAVLRDVRLWRARNEVRTESAHRTARVSLLTARTRRAVGAGPALGNGSWLPWPPGPHQRADRRRAVNQMGLRGVCSGGVVVEVGWCLRWFVLVHEGAPELGVGLARAGEVTAHDG